jgi:hypothetical protein
MSQPSAPNAQDLVLGGQLPPPVSGAVLGGLAGLEHRFNQADMTQKLAALAEAATYGESALPLLQRGLQDENLQVRMAAYLPLKSLKLNDIELKRGLPLRVGDRIHAVYRSSVAYGDDWHYIDSDISEWYHEAYPFYKKDVSGKSFNYISDLPNDNRMDTNDAYEMPNLVAYYVDWEAAEAKAQTVYEEKFGNLGCEIYEVYPHIESEEDSISESFDLKAWVEANKIIVDANLPEGWEDDYEFKVLMSLQNQKQFSLLRELWQQKDYKPLAFVHEYVIDRPCYLRLTALES